jgi:hypothetical protein
MKRLQSLAPSSSFFTTTAILLTLASTASAQFGDTGGGGAAGGGSSGWKVAIDPPAMPLTVEGKDLSIPIPQGFGHGAGELFPSSVSPFVALGKNGFDNDVREVWDLRTKTKVGTLRGKADYGKTTALSPDGAFIAGKPTFRDAIEVRSTQNGKLVQTVEPIPAWTSFVDFGHKGQVIGGNLRDKSLRVWSVKSGEPAFDLHFGGGVEAKSTAFSPGRRYFAIYSKDDSTLRVFDLSDGGKVAGEQVVTKGDGDAFNPDCKGVAFSNDGADLAAIFEQFGKVRIVAWDGKDGKITADHSIDPKSKDKVAIPTFYEDLGIQWLPDKSGWLAFGSSIVDRESGLKVWNLPFDTQNFTVSPRRLIDNERALIVFGGGKILRVAPVPHDKVKEAVKIVREGGNAADAALPKLKPADWSGVKSVSYSQAAAPWSATPDPAPASSRLASRPIALKTKLGEISSIAMSGPTTAQAVVAGSPSAFGKPDTNEGVQRWVDRYDLAGGRHLGRVDIPAVSEFVAFSPDATKILIREAKTKDRLDVFGVDGKPVVGWRPYDREAGDGRAVTYAGFLDADRVVTLSGSGRLVLWSLPQVKAVYSVEDAFHGTPTLSPGRSTLAGFSGETIRFIDAATGSIKGESPGPAVSVGQRVELKASTFRGDGAEWAGLFGGGQIVRVDVKSGKVVAEFLSPVLAGQLEYCGPNYLMADGKNLIDLAYQRAFWAYQSGPSSSDSPDGRHWFVCARSPNDPAYLAAVMLPEKGMEKIAAMAADPNSPAVVRPGMKVSLQLEFNGPPRKPDEFRKAVYDLVASKLKAAGLAVAPGQPVTFAVRVTEKNTGETLQLRKIGFGAAPGGPFNRDNLLSIPVVDLDSSLTVADASGAVPAASSSFGMRSFFHILHLPAGEKDVEQYLKVQQWNGLKHWLETTSMPYFVARSGTEIVRLSGFTDLNNLYGAAR